MPTNCSAAKQLPQFCKHSKSADLLRKSLLSHVWRVPSSKALSCKHERLFDLLTLALLFYCSFPSSPAQRLYKNLSPFIFTGHHFPVQPTAYCFAQLKQGTCLIRVKADIRNPLRYLLMNAVASRSVSGSFQLPLT